MRRRVTALAALVVLALAVSAQVHHHHGSASDPGIETAAAQGPDADCMLCASQGSRPLSAVAAASADGGPPEAHALCLPTVAWRSAPLPCASRSRAPPAYS